MEINNNLKELIESNILTFSTIKKNNSPHNIYVAFVKVIEDNKILINDNCMKKKHFV